MDIFILLTLAICCAFASGAIASENNRTLGVVLGLVLGPIGLIVTAIALSKD